MGYETSLQLIGVRFAPERRAEIEHRLRNPQSEPAKAFPLLRLMGTTSENLIEFDTNRAPELISNLDPDKDGFTRAAIGRWGSAEAIARWLARTCLSGEVILHSLEGDGDAFGWEFKNGRLRYLELRVSGPWERIPPGKRWKGTKTAPEGKNAVRWSKGLRELRAISIRQPWAWLVSNGIKDIENRSKPIRYRGPLLIHAGLNEDGLDRDEIAKIERRHKLRLPETYDTGGIVGVVDVVDCRKRPDSPWHHRGSFGWVLANARRLPFRECKGALGIFRPKVGE